MPTDPRRVLVAGATGRLGAVTHALLARGHAVRAMTRDVVALAVLAIERPSDFAGERIRVASDELNAEEAADALSRQTGRQFAAQQLDTDELGPGLQALFLLARADRAQRRHPGVARPLSHRAMALLSGVA